MPLLLQGQLVYSGETIFMLDEHLDGHLGLSSKKAAVPPVQQKASQPRPPTPVRRHCWQPLQPVGQLLQPVGQTPQPAGETPQRALTRAYRSASEDDEDDAAADVNLSDDDAANAAADTSSIEAVASDASSSVAEATCGPAMSAANAVAASETAHHQYRHSIWGIPRL